MYRERVYKVVLKVIGNQCVVVVVAPGRKAVARSKLGLISNFC